MNHQKRLKFILGNEASHLARPLSVPFWKLFHWSCLPRPRKCLQLSESSGAREKKSHRALHLPKKKRKISQKEKENIPKRKCIHPKSVPFFPTRWRAQPCRRRSSSKSTCLASMGRSSPAPPCKSGDLAQEFRRRRGLQCLVKYHNTCLRWRVGPYGALLHGSAEVKRTLSSKWRRRAALYSWICGPIFCWAKEVWHGVASQKRQGPSMLPWRWQLQIEGRRKA